MTENTGVIICRGGYFMTEQEKDAAVGRMVTRFSELKKHRAALIAEGRTIGDKLVTVGESLRSLEFVHAFADGRTDGYSRNKADLIVTEYPETGSVTTLLNELRQVASELRHLRSNLKDAGLGVE
jgi:hypothetical protein